MEALRSQLEYWLKCDESLCFLASNHCSQECDREGGVAVGGE